MMTIIPKKTLQKRPLIEQDNKRKDIDPKYQITMPLTHKSLKTIKMG